MNEQLKIVISAVTDKFKSAIADTKKDITSFKDQVKKASKSIDEDFKKAGASIAKGLKVGIKGVAALGTAVSTATAVTKEYRDNQAKLTTAFEAAGGAAADAAKTYNDLYRVLGDDGQATEAAAHLAKLTTNEKELSEWTNICKGIYATFGDSLPIEGLTEAANETAKVGTVTGGLADALNWAGVSEDAFNESLAACNTEAEREALIRETLNGLYNDAAATYEKNNADVLAHNEAQAKLVDSLAKVGAAAQPILNMLMELATNILSVLEPYIQEFSDKYLPDIKELLSGVGEALSSVLGFMLEHKELLITIAAVIGTVSAAIGIYNAVTAIKAAMDAAQVTTIWGLVAAHIAQAAAALAAIAPYILIVAAIAAVIAIIVVCIKYWDELVAWVKKAVNTIIEWVTNLWNTITEGLKKAWEWVTNLLSGFGDWIYNKVIAPIGNFFKNMWNGFIDGAKAAWEGVKSIFSKVTDFFRNIFTRAWEAVKNVFSAGGKIFTGIKDGIVNAFKAVVNAIIKGINKVVAVPFNAINKVLDKIRGIEILGFQPFTWVHTFNVPQIPLLARGGIVDSATLAMIGEQGKEAVIPLENNMEWLDKLADRLNDKTNSTPAIIKLFVDGKVFAQTAVSTINDLTSQTGSLQLVLV